MTSAMKKLLEDALALPEEEREVFVEALSESLDPDTVQLSPEWSSEIRSRIAQIERPGAENDPLGRDRRPRPGQKVGE